MAKKKATEEQLAEAAALGIAVNANMLETTVIGKIEEKKAELAAAEDKQNTPEPEEGGSAEEQDGSADATPEQDEPEVATVTEEQLVVSKELGLEIDPATTEEEAGRLIVEAQEAKAQADKEAEEAAKQVQEQTEEVAVEKITWDKTKAVLTAQDMSFEEKMTKLKTEGITAVKSLVTKLEGYQEVMSPKATSVAPTQGAAKNFDLLSTIKSVANTEDYAEFKAKFDIVNAFFREYKDDAYSEWLLHRFDIEWAWGKESLTAFQFLATVISMLCSKATREEQLTKVNLDNALDKELTNLSDTAVENIKKYYQA